VKFQFRVKTALRGGREDIGTGGKDGWRIRGTNLQYFIS
jgi:hypothetical protein